MCISGIPLWNILNLVKHTLQSLGSEHDFTNILKMLLQFLLLMQFIHFLHHSSFRHPLEIKPICWFGGKETFPIIFNVENSGLHVFLSSTSLLYLKDSLLNFKMKIKKTEIFCNYFTLTWSFNAILLCIYMKLSQKFKYYNHLMLIKIHHMLWLW